MVRSDTALLAVSRSYQASLLRWSKKILCSCTGSFICLLLTTYRITGKSFLLKPSDTLSVPWQMYWRKAFISSSDLHSGHTTYTGWNHWNSFLIPNTASLCKIIRGSFSDDFNFNPDYILEFLSYLHNSLFYQFSVNYTNLFSNQWILDIEFGEQLVGK